MSEHAIKINKLSKTFGSGRRQNLVVDNLSLTVKRGEVFGFLGPNGAGKSTSIKLLLRFLKADSGKLYVFGEDIYRKEFRHHIGYLPEFPFFYDHLTAKETLQLSGRLSGMSGSEIRERIPLLLERMNLGRAAKQRVGGFSKGMKQRLGMANALIHDPDLFIFDEPMSGLDPVGRHLIKELITELRTEGKTIFFSSHILSDIEELCDRIGIINRGVLLFDGQLSEFLQDGHDLESSFVHLVEEADRASTM